jgi:hypothetical protein
MPGVKRNADPGSHHGLRGRGDGSCGCWADCNLHAAMAGLLTAKAGPGTTGCAAPVAAPGHGHRCCPWSHPLQGVLLPANHIGTREEEERVA